MIAHHHIHALLRQHAMPVKRSAIEQHLREAHVVRNGGQQTLSPGEHSVICTKSGADQRGIGHQRAGRAPRVDGGDASAHGRRRMKSRLAHTQWREQFVLEIPIKTLATGHFDHAAHHVHRHAVGPLASGVGQQRQPRDAVGKLLDRARRIQQAGTSIDRIDRAIPECAVGETGAVREQMRNRDRTRGGAQ